MSNSIDDIWAEALIDSSPRLARSTRTPERDKSPSALFLDDPFDIDVPDKPNDQANEPTDIDALFADLDEEPPRSKEKSSRPFDINAYRREAEERAAKAVSGNPIFSKYAVQSSSPPRDDGRASESKSGGKKKAKGKEDDTKQRKPVPKLDENRLLGKDGFPALLRQVKDFKPRGKGHEACVIAIHPSDYADTILHQISDLNRLMNIYQFWTHRLHPKIQFGDNVQRIERVCRSRRMQVGPSFSCLD